MFLKKIKMKIKSLASDNGLQCLLSLWKHSTLLYIYLSLWNREWKIKQNLKFGKTISERHILSRKQILQIRAMWAWCWSWARSQNISGKGPQTIDLSPTLPHLLVEVTELGSKRQKLTLGVSWFEQDLSTLKDVYEQEEEIRLYLRVKGFFHHMVNFTQRVLINGWFQPGQRLWTHVRELCFLDIFTGGLDKDTGIALIKSVDENNGQNSQYTGCNNKDSNKLIQKDTLSIDNFRVQNKWWL